MNILLTGSNGFLGSFIFNSLSNHSIFTLNTHSSHYNVDLSKELPQFHKSFDLVIHSAGKAHFVPKTLSEREDFFNINFIGTQNLLDGLSQLNFPKYFVFVSSVSVYGKITGIKISESSPLLALDAYGISKIKAEQIILDWCQKHNVICTILRLPLIVGENPRGNLRSMINGIRKGYYFNIGEGNARKSMVLAEDIANSLLDIAMIGGIYNLTDGYHPSFFELSNYISVQLKKNKPKNMPIWFARFVAKFGDLLGEKAPLNSNKLLKITSDLTFDDTKARNILGWNPTPVLDGFKFYENDK